jgi:basic membrane protein A and related proteins
MRVVVVKKFSLAIVLAGSLLASACGSTSTPTATGPQFPNFTACMVTDTGGIDDRSFNASAWQGALNAQKDFGVKAKYLSSKTENDYDPFITTFLGQSCGIIVTVGFLMGDITQKKATANATQKFAIVDYNYSPAITNVLGLVYETNQDAFMGGYLAAGMSKTGAVGTFGGQQFSTVTIYMDGFAAGVYYYNKQHSAHVKVLGWNPAKQTGTFSGDFTSQDKGQNITNALIQQGADVIFPVAGNVGLGAAAAVQATNGKATMEWVDTDGCISAAKYCPLFLTSVQKGIAVSVEAAIKAAAEGSFQGGNYDGTLANGGVALAPYHNFDSKIPGALKSEIDAIKQGIIGGSISVKPADWASFAA